MPTPTCANRYLGTRRAARSGHDGCAGGGGQGRERERARAGGARARRNRWHYGTAGAHRSAEGCRARCARASGLRPRSIASPQVIEQLSLALKDVNAEVRQQVVHALAEIMNADGERREAERDRAERDAHEKLKQDKQDHQDQQDEQR